MSECVRNCRLCDKFILSTAVNFDSATNELIIGLPANAYGNCQKYCIVIAQSIPESTTINAQVVFAIGDNPTRFPFVNCNCTPIYASQVRTRRIYATRVNTAVNAGVFKYIGKCCLPSNATTNIASIPVATATTTNTTTPAVASTTRSNTSSSGK